MSDKRRTKDELEKVLSLERYESIEAAIEAAVAASEPGDIIQIHAADCPVDDEDSDEGCNCEPIVMRRPAVQA